MWVLVADDDAAQARALDRCLRSWGYEVMGVLNGADAWKALRQKDAPRIVILDWDMPGLSGLEVCRLLRATLIGASSYVLILTGRLQKDDLVAALESGANDFLSKPYDLRELQLRLAKGVRDFGRDWTASPAPPSLAPPSGSTLGSKYRLERKIGEGGMGTVWLGVHLSLGINVAIKLMAPSLAETADYASFEREARAAAQLRDEHTVRVYDHGITEGGSPYLVMEYLSGESLAAWIQRRGPLPPDAVGSLVEQIAQALAEAHSRALVHRDVKPENVFIVHDATREHGFVAKLIDFGLAKAWSAPGEAPQGAPPGGEGASPNQAARSDIAGTPSYSSPECLAATSGPTPLLDLWGLAATAFLAMVGADPFRGENLLQLYQSVCVDPLPVPSTVRPGIPAAFDAWFARACARDPAARFASALELALAIRPLRNSSGPGPASTPESLREHAGFAPTEPGTVPVRGHAQD